MVRGRQKDQWTHTTHLITTLVNFSAVRDPKSSPLQFNDVYPFARKAKPIFDMNELREAWNGMVEANGLQGK